MKTVNREDTLEMPPKKGKGKKKSKAKDEGGDEVAMRKRQIVDEIHNAEDIKDLAIK